MSEKIIVLAHALAKPGSEKNLEDTVRKAIRPTHAEPGCLKYAFHRAASDPRAFVMIEKWASQKTLDQHLAAPHIRELFSKLPALLEKPLSIEVYRAVGEGLPEKLI